MHGKPRLLLWNYNAEEKARMNQLLQEVGVPSAFAIEKNQGHMLIKDIILHTENTTEQEFECDEHIVLFYHIPNKDMSLLIEHSKVRKLPRPIYAAVTEHSIHWKFSDLVRELLQERDAFQRAQGAESLP